METGELDIYGDLYVLSPVPFTCIEFHRNLTVSPSLSEVNIVVYIRLFWGSQKSYKYTNVQTISV